MKKSKKAAPKKAPKKKKRIPTPTAGRQKGNVKTQNMRKRSAY